ncbi:hypothetical protein T492DRAFT_1012087 [Pavlovales sp. CCMP2436]|nr:hypothetical protein T492DRAFT_1012087 [Pavlovales sp. CCMP2436]
MAAFVGARRASRLALGASPMAGLRPARLALGAVRAFSSQPKTFFLETHGCQMNLADSDVVRAVLTKAGWAEATAPEGARVLLTNTCSIREKAENKVRTRLAMWRAADRTRKLGVLGCMASRLREELTESGMADVVAGPDSYRHLPVLLEALDGGAAHAIHTQLSLEETYADIAPVRSAADGSSPVGYVTVMRGCNNMCSYCVVPFTRGRERSRALKTIVEEVRSLVARGVREVVLLGQNVNSYWDRTTLPEDGGGGEGEVAGGGYHTAEGFGNMYKSRDGAGARFAHLLRAVAEVSPELRVRFTSPHPKDFPPEVLDVVAEVPNVCKQLHLPAQSGSSSVLASMEDHLQTLSLLKEVCFEQAFMYAYSLRSKTHASHHMQDDVPRETKQRRLREVIDTFHAEIYAKNAALEFGAAHVVLVEGPARKAEGMLTGRSDGNKRVVFAHTGEGPEPRVGEYAVVRVHSATGHTLRGETARDPELQSGGVRPATLAESTALAARLTDGRHDWLAQHSAGLAAAEAAGLTVGDDFGTGRTAAAL